MQGVYIIKNTNTNKVYVGSSASKYGIVGRLRHHKSALKHNRHANKYLQAAYNKDGGEAFIYETLEECEPSKCLEREQYYIDLYKSYEPQNGYNLCRKAGNTLGRTHSIETKLKIGQNRVYSSPVNKGQKMSKNFCRKVRNSQKKSLKLKQHLKLLNKNKRKPVIGVNSTTGETLELAHASADKRFTKGGICMCCKGKIETYKGFKWSYK